MVGLPIVFEVRKMNYLNWYRKVKEASIGGSTSPSPSVPMTSTPMSQEVAGTPRQIYTRDDVIQNREDLAPSMLRKKKKKKCQKEKEIISH